MRELIKEPALSWLTTALKSSLGKKLVMAVTGLLLCGFLVVHLAGNLLLYVSAEAYNNYAHSLHKQAALLVVAEVGLAGLFVAHLYLAISTSLENRAARRVAYEQKESKLRNRVSGLPLENWMFTSGAVVLAFVLLHLADFRMGLRNPGSPDEEPFVRATRLLQDPITTVGYIVGCLILGIHLGHGVQSAFQTLGLNHPRYNRLIQCAGITFAIVIALGFASFPIWAHMRAG